MKIKSFLFAALFVSTVSFAQETAVADTSWKSGGIFSLGFSQVSLSNWAAGGFSSVSGNGVFSLFKNYAKDKVYWDNSLDLGYGILRQEDGRDETTKTDDRLDIASKYGREAWNDKWYYSVLGNFKTQFTEGVSTLHDDINGTDTTFLSNGNIGQVRDRISDFLAPGYALLALGLDHKPNDHFTLFISPITAKFTIVGDDDLARAGAFGVQGNEYEEGTLNVTTPFENSRTEVGAYLKAVYTKELMKNVALMTKLDLFTNYQEDPFTHTDVNWEMLLGLTVNDYISANIGFQTIYDHDITIVDEDGNAGPRTQFKQLLGLGFNYKF